MPTKKAPGEWTDGKFTRPTTLAARRRTPQMGDPSGGLTRQEEKILREHGSGRGIIGFAAIGTKTAKILTGSARVRPGIRRGALISVRSSLILRSDSSPIDSIIRLPDSELSNASR